MNSFLATDLGGTKILFQVLTEPGDIVVEQNYASAHFSCFEQALAEFLAQEVVQNCTIVASCVAVAGPVSDRYASVTNLPWQIDADSLAREFAIGRVMLCNDFEAVAHGISCLNENELVTLQQGEEDKSAPRAVLGAGTGLGQALLIPQNGKWQVIATEGGHADFGPRDRIQILLLEHLIERFGHVSYERLLSGAGLVAIYDFLRAVEQYEEDPALRQLMLVEDRAAAISQFALEAHDPLARESLQLFIKIYGAQAGNLALSVLPMGGLYIAGGIAAKNLAYFQHDDFLQAFRDKGKMVDLMAKIPVKLILQPNVGLIGACLLAQQSLL